MLFTSTDDNASDAGERVSDSDGAPEPGDWRQIYFEEGSQGSITYAEFRYGGYTSAASGGDVVTVENSSSPVIIDRCVFRDSGQTAIFLKGAAKVLNTEIYDSNWEYWTAHAIKVDGDRPFAFSIVDCTMKNNEGAAIQIDDPNYILSCTIENITAADNGVNAVYLNGGVIEQNGDIAVTTLPIAFDDIITIGDDDSETAKIGVTIQPGVLFKSGGRIDVNDKLLVSGTAEAPVIFTSQDDDAIDSRDTFGDGQEEIAERGDWAGFKFLEGSAGIIDHAMIRYAGSWNSEASAVLVNSPITMQNTSIYMTHYSAVRLHAGAILDNVIIDDAQTSPSYGAHGIQIAGDESFKAIVTNCTIKRCKDDAISCDPNPFMTSVFENLTCSENSDNAITVHGNFTESGTIDVHALPVHMSGDWYIGDSDDSTPKISVTVDPGVVIKSSGSRIVVNDNFYAVGTASEPVIFTSSDDDAIDGYDLRGDGMEESVPEAGDWDGIHYTEGSGGALEYAEFYYGGAWTMGASGLLIESPIQFSNCLVTETQYSGVKINASMTVSDITVVNSGHSGSYEATGIIADADNGAIVIQDCVLQGNQSSGIRVSSINHSTDVEIEDVVCRANGSDGISFNGSGASTIRNCELVSNEGDGVWIENEHSVTGTKLLIANNGDDGVNSRSSGSLTIHQSDIVDNEGMAVEMDTAKVADFQENYWGDPSGPYDDDEQVDRQNDDLNLLNETSLGGRVTDFVDWGNPSSVSWFQEIAGDGLIPTTQYDVSVMLLRTYDGDIPVFGANLVACQDDDSLIVGRKTDGDYIVLLTASGAVDMAKTDAGYSIQGIAAAGPNVIQVLVKNNLDNVFAVYKLIGPFTTEVSNWLMY